MIENEYTVALKESVSTRVQTTSSASAASPEIQMAVSANHAATGS